MVELCLYPDGPRAMHRVLAHYASCSLQFTVYRATGALCVVFLTPLPEELLAIRAHYAPTRQPANRTPSISPPANHTSLARHLSAHRPSTRRSHATYEPTSQSHGLATLPEEVRAICAHHAPTRPHPCRGEPHPDPIRQGRDVG